MTIISFTDHLHLRLKTLFLTLAKYYQKNYFLPEKLYNGHASLKLIFVSTTAEGCHANEILRKK